MGFTGSCIQYFQIFEGLLLQRDEDACDDLLPLDCLGLQAVGNDVVDVLDEDDIGLDLVEVLNEGSVTTRTEE